MAGRANTRKRRARSACRRKDRRSLRPWIRRGEPLVIAVGEAYESKASAKNGIDSVKKNAASAAEVVDLTEK